MRSCKMCVAVAHTTKKHVNLCGEHNVIAYDLKMNAETEPMMMMTTITTVQL